MVHRTSNDNFIRSNFTSDGRRFYMKEKFETKIFSSDRYTSNNQSLLSRMRNHLVKAINDYTLLPKIIVVIFDRDFIATVSHEEQGISLICGIDINWLAREYSRIIETHKERLPERSKNHDSPVFIWMLAPLHKGFTDNSKRIKFNKTLQHIMSFHQNMITMKMVKEWDYTDSSMFVHEAKRFTSSGLKCYWTSVDSAIEHYDTYLSKRRRDNDTNNGNKSGQGRKKPGFVKKLHFDFKKKSNQFKWNNSKKNKEQHQATAHTRRQLPSPTGFEL